MGATEKPNEIFKTEQGISECYMEGVLKHSGSISGFIYVVTQLVKNSEGDGSLIMADVDEALSRLLGELGASVTLDPKWQYWPKNRQPPILLPHPGHEGLGKISRTAQDDDNREVQDDDQRVPTIEEVVAQAAESLADPNFFIAEISGILSALVELKDVCHRRRTAGGNENL